MSMSNPRFSAYGPSSPILRSWAKVTSFLGRLPLVGNRSAYNAAKAALNSLTANLRMDLRRTNPGIKVSLVMPGMVSTDFAKNALYGNGSTPATGTSGAAIQAPQEVAEI